MEVPVEHAHRAPHLSLPFPPAAWPSGTDTSPPRLPDQPHHTLPEAAAAAAAATTTADAPHLCPQGDARGWSATARKTVAPYHGNAEVDQARIAVNPPRQPPPPSPSPSP
eukprot:Sspe_Gene.40514::Locus_19577_Transcript_1_1_Confidence_1.000_Length_1381::g.40514::m.40514